MKTIDNNTVNTKVVCPPPPSASYLFTSIYSITLKEDQDVEWQWLELPDGNRVVIDYKIIARQATKENQKYKVKNKLTRLSLGKKIEPNS